MRYTPFDVDLYDITESHLAGLRDVAEGWYVEYKSEVPKPRDLARSLSSFANRYGGWLFLGIQEDTTDNTAGTFPGLRNADVPATAERLRDAAKDLLQPSVPFFHHTVSGPLPDISLPPGHSIVIARVPEGASPPYVHNDGRIYIRTADSSSPTIAADRSTLDILHRKAEQKMSVLGHLIDRTPAVSKGEEDTTYIHFIISSDPFQVLGHRYSGTFMDFCAAMGSSPLPFDNIYTSQDGYIARQSRGNERRQRLFTWEFSRTCDSFITLPLSTLEIPHTEPEDTSRAVGELDQYLHGVGFARMVAKDDLRFARVLNLNMLVTLVGGIIARHRSLAGHAGVGGPFYLKAKIENAWRVIPFVDTLEYISHIDIFGVPVVQDSDLTVPIGDWPDGFITVPELNEVPREGELAIDNSAITTWIAIMEALGIPGEVLAKSADKVLRIAIREAERHRNRLEG